jgi:hypothetical protein
VAAPTGVGARSALFFLFNPASAEPGDRVTVRTAGTPQSFEPSRRIRPFQRPYRLYLVPNELAGAVRSRFDPRVHFIGSLRPDKNGRGTLAFTVPPLEPGSYATAVWCPGCARSSRGRTFSVLGVGSGTAARYRPLMLLRVAEQPVTAGSCPGTAPNGNAPPGLRLRTPPGPRPIDWHGNGALFTGLPPGGVFTPRPVDVEPDGSIGTKWYWLAAGVDGSLTVQGRRLDSASTPLQVHRVNRGTLSGYRGATWATPITFPTAGCWQLTARLEDVSLSFVVRVVRPTGA